VRGLVAVALAALCGTALGSGVTYLALRPALQTARSAPPAPNSGGSGKALVAGNAAFDRKDWPTAVADYTQAIAGGLDNPDVRTDLGTAYRNLRQPQKALEQYQAAQREDPAHENSLLNQGIVYAFDLGDAARATALWRQYLQRFPHGQHVADVKHFLAAAQAHPRPERLRP